MAYAAYRDPPGASSMHSADLVQVLDITVPCVDCCRVRRALALVDGAGVLRCEPLVHPGAACDSGAPRARLLVRLPLSRYADVLHRVLACVPDGEIGQLVSWRSHLRRVGVAYGG